MISTDDLTLNFGKRILFESVNVKFTPGNCYGLIGANGAGKSTFLRCLSGEQEITSGAVHLPKDVRMSVLRQDQFAFDDMSALHAVIKGHERLFTIMQEKDAIYAKPDFSDEDGIAVSELEAEFADLNGWDAEPAAANLLSGLGIKEASHEKKMRELEAGEKVRVLLAQALFGDPEVLLLDEPTNHLDVASILWLENFLLNFRNTVIVVSHDRHFLNKVCSHIADIDYQKLQLFTGNYDFWYQSSQLALKQRQDSNKKKEDKAKELKTFIQRFSANASKSKQATARRKLLDKINLDDIKPSSRKYPYIVFKSERELGKEVLRIENLAAQDEEGTLLFENLNLAVTREDKIAFVGKDGRALRALMDILGGTHKPLRGELHWGLTVTLGHFPRENSQFFDTDENLVQWLRQFSENKEENFVRSFLGRMLFTGEESAKPANVLSGGEKVRCMLSRLMLRAPNVLALDEPTNHLDLESITALNNGLMSFEGAMLLTSHDVQFVDTLANRIIEVGPGGIVQDVRGRFEDYLAQQNQAA